MGINRTQGGKTRERAKTRPRKSLHEYALLLQSLNTPNHSDTFQNRRVEFRATNLTHAKPPTNFC
jgi:hypothetical protein